jgi:glucose-fructose oxidoreductase
VLVGQQGTLSSYDLESTIRLQTHDCPAGVDLPVDPLLAPLSNPVDYFLDRLERGLPVEGPLDPAICRIGQQIVDTAAESARLKRTLPLRPWHGCR